MKNLGNVDGEQYYSSPEVVDYIMHFVGTIHAGARVLCPTAGDGAIAKRIATDTLYVNDISADMSGITNASHVSHEDARTFNPGVQFDVIVDNLPMYVIEHGRNICTNIIKNCYYNLLDQDTGTMYVTVPHNFMKKAANRALLADIPHMEYLVTEEDIPSINWPFYLLLLMGTGSNKNKPYVYSEKV